MAGNDPSLRHYFTRLGAFTSSECDAVTALGRQLQPASQIQGPVVGKPVEAGSAGNRNSRIVWLHHDRHTDWLYQKLIGIVSSINREIWRFDLAGTEALQFASYAAGEYYNWHTDLGHSHPTNRRKLSVSIQLSSSDEYGGGDLEIKPGARPKSAPRDRGSMFMFPSYVRHRVAPVRRGERLSLVAWISSEQPFK